MLEIVFLAACGWLMMYNPTDTLKFPITERHPLWASDTAAECENHIAERWKRAEELKRDSRTRTVYVCPPMLFTRTPRPKNKIIVTRQEIEQRTDYDLNTHGPLSLLCSPSR